ncbi:MAG: helix-turn-helix domain-containing protein [Chloroflexi bacterium]|nr:helix-turn-helix domain-containing protein [Chloroflexota bacterium]
MTEWITVPEAAELSGYHENYLRLLIRNGDIKAEKRGGHWWVERKSVERYLTKAKKADDNRYGPKNES